VSPDLETEARALATRTRRAQKLPELVEDAGVLARVARIISPRKETDPQKMQRKRAPATTPAPSTHSLPE